MRAHRPAKIASVIQRLISEVLGRHLHDPRISPMTTVTRVEVSTDLQVAKVFLSVLGEDTTEKLTVSAIQHAAGRVQQYVARGLPLRHCPQLRFLVDPRIKGAQHTLELIEQNRLARGEPAEDELGEDEPSPDAQSADEPTDREPLDEEGPGSADEGPDTDLDRRADA